MFKKLLNITVANGLTPPEDIMNQNKGLDKWTTFVILIGIIAVCLIVYYITDKIDKKKQSKHKDNKNEEEQQNAKTIIAVADIEKNRASDGHICKSEGEVIIDDILFKVNVCHAYERRVKEIPSYKDRSVIADWFIPLGGFEGIYIEYWGMNKKDYQDNKEEKLKLYEKYSSEVKLIQIDKNDINDRQNLEDRIFTELKQLGWHK